MKEVEATGKTVEEALAAAAASLGVSPADLEYTVLEEPRHGFLGIGSRPARIAATVKKVEPVEKAKHFLQELLAAMHMSVCLEKMTADGHVVINFRGQDLGILIGRHGQTLDALQYLTNLVANRGAEERVRIILDVEDYRKRRAETLRRLALRVADRVKKGGRPVTLEPMSPQERKVIHMALQGDHRIVTYSNGEEPYRKVTISLKK